MKPAQALGAARLPITMAWTLACLLALSSCGGDGTGAASHAAGDTRTQALLKQPLWRPRDAYDAAHHLMVPMHGAFGVGNAPAIAAFDRFIDVFSSNRSELVGERLDRLHFLYLLSRYGVLAARSQGCNARLDTLVDWVRSDLASIVQAPAWQWDAADFASLLARVHWRLDTVSVGRSYYRAVIDEDLFALAVGADLLTFARVCGRAAEPWLVDTFVLANEVFRREVVPQAGGGWLFQPGVWRDHPDYAHAGRTELAPQLEPLVVDGIAGDSSHSFRMPLFLLSFGCAAAPGSAERVHFDTLRSGLQTQLLDVVVVPPNAGFAALRLSNYMDGRNGVYRYGYPTQGVGVGFGPYQLSGSFQLGWWAFLGPAVQALYRDHLARLPLAPNVVQTYVGPNTMRQRNPDFAEPDFHRGELLREILSAAAGLAATATACE